jgi:hypothetical protein
LGGSGQFTVDTSAGCQQWTVSGGGGWATVTGNGSGTGPGSVPVTYTVAKNEATSSRTTTLVVTSGSATATHTVNQEAAVPPPPPVACGYSIDPERREFEARGGSGGVRVMTGETCQWTALSGADWVSIPTSTGTGSRDVQYQVAPNTSIDDRRTTITINGQVHRIDQRRPNDDLEWGHLLTFEPELKLRPPHTTLS